MAESPEIDLTKIAFPSDGMTLKDIRRIWPDFVDAGEVTIFSRNVGPADWVFAMLTMERDLARATYALKLGSNNKCVHSDNVTELGEDLSGLYVEYGIANGPSTANELIRGIESQANMQASQHLPPRP